MTLKWLSLGIAALVLAGGLIYAGKWVLEEWRYRALLADRALIAGDRDVSAKAERPCPATDGTLVFVIFGQSNAANHGDTGLRAPDAAFDFYGGRCFEGHDPQFSATGKGGSLWPAFADSLRAAGETRPILTANVAVGNTPIAEWMPGTKHARFLIQETRALSSAGYQIAGFLFFQGESDRKTPVPVYRDALTRIADMIDAEAPDVPLIIADTSICALEEAGGEKSAPLSRARIAAASDRKNIIVGPDTDMLGPEYRYDGCHFNRRGLQALGALWADSVRQTLD